jgi:hypothetical protein
MIQAGMQAAASISEKDHPDDSEDRARTVH